MSQFSLLATRRFAPFFWTQALGAFNDNLYKTTLTVSITFEGATLLILQPENDLRQQRSGFTAGASKMDPAYQKRKCDHLVSNVFRRL